MSKVNGNPPLTDWFPGTVKPVRVGAYQRELPSGALMFWHWSGKHWDWGAVSQVAFCEPDPDGDESLYQDLPWRGLSAPAKEA